MAKYQKLIDVSAMCICIILLITQAVLLNVFCINYCSNSGKRLGSLEGKLWFIGDSLVLILWIFGFYKAYVHFSKEKRDKDETDYGVKIDWKKAVKLAMAELPLAYAAWLAYAVIIVFKIVIMFDEFAEGLKDKGFYSSTSLKIILSLSGPIFLCLVYGHHRERNSDYKSRLDRVALHSAFGILDSLILLNNLFVEDTRLVLVYGLDKTIKAFTCINYLLPVLSLLLLRILTQQKYKKFKSVNFVVVVSSVQTFLVDIPLFGIRLYLWLHHDVDISIFITKNLMSFVNAGVDMAGVIASVSGAPPEDDECEMEALELSQTTKDVPISEAATLPMK
ncbi:uncharacterized protein [Antedon mediterranea]|uniref:uncharacterized protein n=1 Tax=Antedon mediterranea TaxID=105859 RepID=UPI003AF63F9E